MCVPKFFVIVEEQNVEWVDRRLLNDNQIVDSGTQHKRKKMRKNESGW
jgi:hypothetical protein